MNGWAQVRPGGVWHQVETRAGGVAAWFPCLAKIKSVRDRDVMDYRWRPDPLTQCRHVLCQREVEP